MNKIAMLALFSVLILPGLSHATGRYFYTGSELAKLVVEYQKANREDQDASYWEAWKFRAFVVGVHDIADGALFCSPHDVGEIQAVAVVAKFVENNPRHWNLPAATVVSLALAEAYPCKTSP